MSKEVVAGASADQQQQQQPTSIRVLPLLSSSANLFLTDANKKQWSGLVAFIHVSRFKIKQSIKEEQGSSGTIQFATFVHCENKKCMEVEKTCAKCKPKECAIKSISGLALNDNVTREIELLL